ncbi:MAG: hypothetical protein ACI9MC_001691 [Kiritimatiellia bacterium]|jgi:hypothetical protein
MIEVSRSLGRVVLVKATTPISELEVLRYQQDLSKAVRTVGAQAIVVVDLRDVAVLPKPVARMFTLMLQSKPLVKRRAFLYSEGETFGAEIAKLVYEEDHPQHKAFASFETMQAYLRPACSPPELTAVGYAQEERKAA